ncbi:MAG: hemerythrin domain-containing protein [Elusimicrobia bacterium]|nr:hemerythrin domain-containing protein [Elusimicrobiota bacterium]
MSKIIIETLKRQHKNILEELTKIGSFRNNISKEEKQIIEGLILLKKTLIDHLRLEENTLYSELLDILEKNALKLNAQTTRTFRLSMKPIGEKVLRFIGKYSLGGAIKDDAEEFLNVFIEIDKALRRRVNSEEDILFPLYIKYCS